MDRGQVVVALPNHGESSELWVEADPSPPKKFIEYVVLLTISIQEASANDVHPQPLRILTERQGHQLQLLDPLELRLWCSLIQLLVGERLAVLFKRGHTPHHGTGEHNKNLINL